MNELVSSGKILSDIIVFNKYAKYLPELNRRETWDEICDRYEGMMIETYPKLRNEIIANMYYVRDKMVLPSMRGAQFAGEAIKKNNMRTYNCSFLAIDHYKAFSDLMFLLLSGTGVGYSVQKRHTNQLPPIKYPTKEQKFLVMDSIEGWSDAIKALVYAYFGGSNIRPLFDLSDIRPKGSRLVVSGGYAPGPEPLKHCLQEIEKIFKSVPEGAKLRPIHCHDIACIIADAVLSGGIRRSALISLFDKDEIEMITCKAGEWWKNHSYRGRANNSVIFDRADVKAEDFYKIWETTSSQGYGEPGFVFTNDLDMGVNPCCEISLNSGQLCNLTSMNGLRIPNQNVFNACARVSAFFGTLQAGFVDFHYVRQSWVDVTKSEYLLGVSITGIAAMPLEDLNLREAAQEVLKENERVASLIGINPAARTTCIKPEGTGSLVVSDKGWVSPGIHGYYAPYIIRRIQIPTDDPLCTHFLKHHPELIEVYNAIPNTHVIAVPLKAPEGALLANQPSLKFLERVKRFSLEWVREGHRSGINYNNVSSTVYVKPDEWGDVGDWMWNNKEFYTGLSVLGYSDHKYPQAPFEAISKEEYERLTENLYEVDITQVLEYQDNTSVSDTVACAGGACELTFL